MVIFREIQRQPCRAVIQRLNFGNPYIDMDRLFRILFGEGALMKKSLSILAYSFVIAAAPVHAMTDENDAPTEVAAADEAVAEEAAPEEVDPMQRVRCRNQRVTGSNARRIRVCLTIAEWSELASNGNRDARRILDESTRDSMQRN